MKFFGVFILVLSQVVGGATIAGQPASVVSPVRPAMPATPIIPVPPPIRSPVEVFRELLAMSPAQRSAALSNRPPEIRKQILAKIREYRSLSENDRELRLRATELEWYLVPLMRTSPTNRAARLAMIPEDDRKMIEARLQEWDQLPEPVRKDLLDRRESIRLYMQMTSGLPTQTNNLAPRRPAVEEGLKKIEAMSDDDRRKLISRFNQYFDLDDREKQKALRTLTPDQQEQIEKTLARFKDLSPQQRAQCIRSFGEFAKMSPMERQQFLKNAERWIVMTPNQRQAWRDVVEKVSLTPPSVVIVPRPPPVPPARSRKPVLTTNGN